MPRTSAELSCAGAAPALSAGWTAAKPMVEVISLFVLGAELLFLLFKVTAFQHKGDLSAW